MKLKSNQYITWNGERWGLYSSGYWRLGTRYLHREKWEKLRGPIPEGWVVHHKDHDRSNCRISNLECLPRGAHALHHVSDSIRSKASITKASVTREKNAVQRGKRISAAHLSKPQIGRPCIQCGEEFFTRSVIARLCSTRCRSNNRYQTRGRERV